MNIKFLNLNKNLETLFWDVDLETLDTDTHKEYIITRILEEGTLADVREILNFYETIQIKNVVKNSRRISAKTGYFWKNYFNIDSEIKCIQKHSQNLPKMPWQK